MKFKHVTQDGLILGTVSTARTGSKAQFEICTVEDYEEGWKDADEVEFNKFVVEQAFQAGVIEIDF